MKIKTIEAMLEAERIAVDPNLKSYTVDEAFEELEKGSPAYIAVKLTGGASEAHNFVSGGRGGTGFCTV